MTRRVVITGIGLVSSLGIGTEANWKALLVGTSGVDRVTRFDVTGYAAQIAAEVRGFDPLDYVEKKDVKKMDVFIQYAIAASQFAMDDSKLTITESNAPDVGVFIGSGIGGFQTIEREHSALLEGGPRKISPFFIPSAIINLASGQVSIRFGAKGPNLATCTACSASAHAIGESFEIIRRGDAEAMIAGGSEAAITPMSLGGFAALRALSTRNDNPGNACRPFDRDRDGFIIGEGAGIVILEELEFARRAERAYLRRGRRLRHLGGRVSHHRAVGRRRGRRARDEDGDQEGGDPSRRDRLHQRPRHLDALQRSPRDDGHQEVLRRARLQDGGVVHQVDDRPPAGRSRRARGRNLSPRRLPSGRSADHQSRQSRPRLRSRLRAAYRARRCRFATRCPTRSGSAGTNASLLFKKFEG